MEYEPTLLQDVQTLTLFLNAHLTFELPFLSFV